MPNWLPRGARPPLLPRGAIPTPRNELVSALRYSRPIGAAPPEAFLSWPAGLHPWGNYVFGDCVSAEEAFAKAVSPPRIVLTNSSVIIWARKHNFLDGAYLTDVMRTMQTDGFPDPAARGKLLDNGSYSAVDWTNPDELASAISTSGPVKIGIAATSLEGYVTAGRSGWCVPNYPQTWPEQEDHCTSLCGYGDLYSLVALFKSHKVELRYPENMPVGRCYAMFTWDSIGVVDEKSLLNMTYEAWVRHPVTVVK